MIWLAEPETLTVEHELITILRIGDQCFDLSHLNPSSEQRWAQQTSIAYQIVPGGPEMSGDFVLV